MTEGHPERSEESVYERKIMWLPRDERYLLMVYYICNPQPSPAEQIYCANELECFFIKKYLWIPFVGPKMVIRLARLLRDQKSTDSTPDGNQSVLSLVKTDHRIKSINTMLKERDLIEVRDCGTCFYEIKMKLKGLDLGRKYASWLTRSGLWFAEYKDHWFWLIVGFLGGIIGALIVNWLSK